MSSISSKNHARIFTATTIGIDAHLIEVEADLSMGLMNFCIVGLPDKAIKESKDRIRAALKNSGLKLPDKLITINLAPADIKKQDALFDVPIAIAILQAAHLIDLNKSFLEETIFLGELSLDGAIKSIKGALPITHGTKLSGKKRVILPTSNSTEASVIQNMEIIGVDSLIQLIAYLRNEIVILPTQTNITLFKQSFKNSLNYSQVKGQDFAKQALVVAATGGHNILFVGPPGSGKTMLAERLFTIMPELTLDESIEITKIYSVAGLLSNKNLILHRPFRNPHHTVSQVGLAGGSSTPIPGEMSLAHHGILFLDELTEFCRSTIETLRQPLESGIITISRAGCAVTFPAKFLLVAALNPCPCGYYKDPSNKCCCTDSQVKKYLGKLSGPLIDRIDIHINVASIKYQDLAINNHTLNNLSSEEMLAMVNKGLAMQKLRNQSIKNAQLSPDQIQQICVLDEASATLLKKYFDKFNISARSYHKILKLARTIADLDQKESIDINAIKQAIFYRSFEKAI